MDKIRSFIAIDVPSPLRAQIGKLQEELRRVPADVRWVRPESIHLTLKFLGPVSEEELEKISAAIAPIVSSRESFRLGLNGAGCFPSNRNPRVLWVGVNQGTAEVTDLQKAVEDQAAESGFPAEFRSFSPHLTMGRVRSAKGRTALIEAMEKHKDVDIGDFSVHEVILFRSDLKPSGAVYTKLKIFPMKEK